MAPIGTTREEIKGKISKFCSSLPGDSPQDQYRRDQCRKLYVDQDPPCNKVVEKAGITCDVYDSFILGKGTPQSSEPKPPESAPEVASNTQTQVQKTITDTYTTTLYVRREKGPDEVHTEIVNNPTRETFLFHDNDKNRNGHLDTGDYLDYLKTDGHKPLAQTRRPVSTEDISQYGEDVNAAWSPEELTRVKARIGNIFAEWKTPTFNCLSATPDQSGMLDSFIFEEDTSATKYPRCINISASYSVNGKYELRIHTRASTLHSSIFDEPFLSRSRSSMWDMCLEEKRAGDNNGTYSLQTCFIDGAVGVYDVVPQLNKK